MLRGVARLLQAFLLALLLPVSAAPAESSLRIASYDVGLAREWAGQLLWDLGREPDPALAGVLAVLRAARPDVVLLSGVDDDAGGRTLDALRALLREGADGIDYPYAFRAPVNAGVPSGYDLDDDGRRAGWADAFGWGKFPGNGGMALLSRLPIDAGGARTFRLLHWS